MKTKWSQVIRRSISVILAIVMVVGLIAPGSFSATAYAAGGQTKAAASTYEIKVGETVTLQATNNQSTWTTSDSKIATVTNKGVVTGISAGTATVTETTTVNNGFWFFWFWNWGTTSTSTKTYTIVVKDGGSVTPEPEDKDAKRIKIGETITLSVTGSNVTWKSSDTAVATVSSKGEVTGVKAGKATITATSVTGTSGGGWFGWIWSWFGWGGSTSTVTEFKVIVTGEEKPSEPETEKPTEEESSEPETEQPTEEETGEPETEQPTEEESSEPETEQPTEEETSEATEPFLPEKERYKVRFESNGGSPILSQDIESGGTVQYPDEPVREGYGFVGWYTNENEINWDNTFDFDEPVTGDTTLYAIWISFIDTDQDGLFDDVEKKYGTDITNIDTDNDGITDYEEVIYFGTDPLNPDSDGDGTADGNVDYDKDGLTYHEENSIGTDQFVYDTDDDGLSDGDEVLTYHTDPLIQDSDGDGASDKVEIDMGTDPNVYQDLFDLAITCENAVEDTVIPMLNIVGEGELMNSMEIIPVDDNALFNEDIPGYMGKAYDFIVNGEFESATISFEFDQANLENGADPAIFYYDEDNQIFEELETTIDGNIASAKTEHFSTYMLIDKTKYYGAFEWEDVWSTDSVDYHGVEVILVVDDSGSMTDNDRYNERLAVGCDLIDKLPANSKIGIVWFASGTRKLTESLITDREIAKSYLTTDYFRASGGTYMYNAINDGFSLFESDAEDILKMMVILSDGDTSDTGKHSSTIAYAKDNNIKLYTLGLGNRSSYFNNYLKPLAEETNGEFYLASNASELSIIYDDINKKIDLEADADGDGIPDYYEDSMIAFNGKKLHLDKNNPDTDGDGVLDGEEVKVLLVYNEDYSKVYVKGTVISYPDMNDSDNDGYLDGDDLNPLVVYRSPIVLLHGLNDNTTCYGVKNSIEPGMNSTYGKEVSDAGSNGVVYNYTDVAAQTITTIEKGRLGSYLEVSKGYSRNKNLFAFNYANHDMVQYNAKRLKTYLSNLINVRKNDKNSEYFFATKKDMESGKVDFILIGHSMGGLVSRYLVENLAGNNISKIITIDTPHYGSGMADSSDIMLNCIKFSPAIIDLERDSALFGNKPMTWNIGLRFGGSKEATQYALNNQSPALNGNQSIMAPLYYAIGGYDVGRAIVFGEKGQLAKSLRNTCFSFEFLRSIENKEAYKNSINSALAEFSMNKCGETSKLDLGESDGDNTVDHYSQFGVRFSGIIKKKIEYVKFKRTAMVVWAKGGCNMANPFHNGIHTESEMFKWIGEFTEK